MRIGLVSTRFAVNPKPREPSWAHPSSGCSSNSPTSTQTLARIRLGGRQLLFEARRRQRATRRGAAAAGGGRVTARARGTGGDSRPARAWGRDASGCCGAPGRGCRLRPVGATRPTRASRPRTGPTSPTPTPAAPTSTTRPGSAAPVPSPFPPALLLAPPSLAGARAVLLLPVGWDPL